jgi:hypothetical protein
MAHAWTGPLMFRYQVTLTAADPRLYSTAGTAGGWNFAELHLGEGHDTGRVYPRFYPEWRYGSEDTPSRVVLTNRGTVPAPVWMTYRGDFTTSRVTDGPHSIYLRPLLATEEILVNSETLVATAPGGATRASMIMPGSEPLTIPPLGSVAWRLYSQGHGRVELRWRDAWI